MLLENRVYTAIKVREWPCPCTRALFISALRHTIIAHLTMHVASHLADSSCGGPSRSVRHSTQVQPAFAHTRSISCMN